MTDTWVQRTADDFAGIIEGELPQGPAWSRDPDDGLMRWASGCAQVWGGVEQRSADLLLVESDPRATFELLPDWERAFGLPDTCFVEGQTIEERRNALIAKITALGGQSIAFFINAAAALGYAITIYEYAPYTCGISECGDTRPAGSTSSDYYWQCGAPELRYYWLVHVLQTRLTWLRGGTGECGQDHHCEFSLALDLECLIRRWAPAHTVVIFDYSEIDYPLAAGDGALLDDSGAALIDDGGDAIVADPETTAAASGPSAFGPAFGAAFVSSTAPRSILDDAGAPVTDESGATMTTDTAS